YGEASALGLGTFASQAVDSTSVLVRYTYAGDANLDGKVNALDFNALATHFGGCAKRWNNGDFNYDSATYTLDCTTLAGNFNLVLPAPSLGQIVPEPTVLLVSAAAIAFAR